MAKASEYVALLSKDRLTVFLACVEDEQRFAEPVHDFRHSRHAPLVHFVVCGRKVTHIKCPHGGRRGTFENVGRHFDNSAFTTVVAKAWVGTTPSQSAVLASAIPQTLQTGKAIAIAVKPKKQDRGSAVSPTNLNEII